MPSRYSPARPFSNGSEADYFDEVFCQRCSKLKRSPEGLPFPENCQTEIAIAEAYFDISRWPQDGNLATDQLRRTVCLGFDSDDAEIMEAYRKAVPQV